VLRPAHFYWRWPYVMEVVYAKKWSESYMCGGTSFKVPFTEHHDTKEYTMKVLDRETLFTLQKEWKEIDVAVVNKVT